jgi:hypothetical protein
MLSQAQSVSNRCGGIQTGTGFVATVFYEGEMLRIPHWQSGLDPDR